ncbi:sigma-54-dependent transcriptional regulator [Tuwongella immobilis]|uniref:DNA-binding transcriptional regulator NtrC n=1 Tax=Tuwongella immobilis TaxID=692036 RepID=A0A6C2YI49_9BACT|nr:sigma-54 dependent transcriptional regulator [Tuwongella immobilis]VIP01208.1 response regulator with -like aaa-type and dna-binding domains : Response regulator with CheY-like receiver, AAA-type ATPase, and DNA-binding domains OS=Singulisphaera acidiphila (strain ATCC BAA-1392 / DSM 18658 / VKM B-2454 / MOB10) GN=Sinac_1278 PE=4 SV=1: Response_reg: Sigma54_activat: HTH_8 [Tuwongella immobilis]VTR97842.1 response regulator with -like aaa-type and dna-binding domains : Response regulator with C
MPQVLVVDDEPFILETFKHLFASEGITMLAARTAAEGLTLFREFRPEVVLTDVKLPDQSGLELFRRLRELDPKAMVILMTGYGTSETAIEAMRLGAYDYLSKPIEPDQLLELVQRASEISRLMRTPAVVAASEQSDAADLLIGRSAVMQEVYKTIGRVAPQDVTVLILGESGTGKELVARAIYHYSRRSSGPFLAINCAAIPETLLESELFGHEKGSFTGADRKRIGKFEQCNNGTLFLDEIGDMSPMTQSKVLRVLQDQQFERVGGNELVQTDVRLIAATNRDLESAMADGSFRSDLYYRLNVCTIRLPPLRERLSDLPLLIEHFLRRFNPELGKSIVRIAPTALELMQRHAWPGNIRELQSTIKQALLMATGTTLLPEFLPETLRFGLQPASSLMTSPMVYPVGMPLGPRPRSLPPTPQPPSTYGVLPPGVLPGGLPIAPLNPPTGSTPPMGLPIGMLSGNPTNPPTGTPPAHRLEADSTLADRPFPRLTQLIRDRINANTGNLYTEIVEAVEKEMFIEVLQSTDGNISQASRVLGISRPTLRSKLQALGLSIERTATLENES